MPFTDVLNEGYFGIDPQVPNDRINYQGLNWNQFATNLLEPNNGVLTNCFTATSQFHQMETPTNFSIESCLNKAFYVCTKPIPGMKVFFLGFKEDVIYTHMHEARSVLL